MAVIFIVIIAIILAALALFCVIEIDVFNILKMVNHETDVDIISFKKCILPFERK